MRAQTKIQRKRRTRTPLASLQKAADANDLRSLVNATRGVDWSACAPQDFIRAVSLALRTGAFGAARDIF